MSRPGQVEVMPVAALPDLPRGILARHASYERLAATTLAVGRPSEQELVRVLLARSRRARSALAVRGADMLAGTVLNFGR